MGNTLTVRLPEDLADWLDQAARKTGVSRGRLVRMELERARAASEQKFLHLAGKIKGAPDLSMRKGYARE